MKKCSISLGIREIQIKTTIRYHLTPVRMTKINKSGNDRCWRGCRERGTLLTLLVGMQTGAATLENSMEVPQKVENRPYDPAIALLGIYQKNTKILNQKKKN